MLVEFPSHDAFSIARPALRRLLLGAVSETAILLGARARRYEQDDRGVTLYFDDGSSERGDLLVACDGVRSALRRQRVADALNTESDVSSAVALYERKICRRGNSAQVMSRQVARAMHWDEAFLCGLRDLQLRVGGAVAGLFRRIRHRERSSPGGRSNRRA